MQMKINTLYIEDNNGLFGQIQKVLDVNWFNNDLAFLLNTEYFYGRSGEKTMSPLCYKIVQNMFLVDDYGNFMYDDNGEYVVSDDYEYALTTLAKLISTKFKRKWDDTYKSLSKEINLDVAHEIIRDGEDRSNAEEINKHTYDNQNKVTTGVYGFDSISSSPVSDSNGESSTKNEENNTFTKDSNNNFTAHHNNEQSFDHTTTIDRINKLIVLRRNLISEIIMKDVDSMLALMVYAD